MYSSPNSRKGFSLLEVCLALFLLVLISGSIYAVLKGTLDLTSNLRENMERRQQVEAFIGLCTRTFHMLPGTAQLESRIRMEDGKALPEIIFRNSPQLLAWGSVEDLGSVTVMGLRPQTGGRFSISLLRSSVGSDPLADPVALAKPEDWLPLVSDVTKLTWRFYDSASDTWLDILSPGQPRSRAVEMTLELADEPEPIRTVFEIIPLATRLRLANQNRAQPNQPNQQNQPNQNNPNNQPNRPNPNNQNNP